MSNKRDEIVRRLNVLNDLYDSFDRFFFSNFKIVSENGKSYLRAKPNAVLEYSHRIDNIKTYISNLWRLCDSHTGGFFDNDAKRELDKRNRYSIFEIEQKVNKLISLYMHYEIIEG